LEHDVKDTNVMGDINVTPMVDVMLVLLVIFMIVTPLITAGFQAQLPEGEHLKSRPEEETRVVLGIDQDGNYFLNKKPIRREDAKNLVTAEFNARPRGRGSLTQAHGAPQPGAKKGARERAPRSVARRKQVRPVARIAAGCRYSSTDPSTLTPAPRAASMALITSW